MGAFQRWLDKQDASCCPDPDPNYIDALDMAEPFATDEARDVPSEYGFDRATPVDTLMAGPTQMHLDYGDDLMFGAYA